MASPTASARPSKPNWSTPLLLLSFALVFLVLFNPALRDATGRWVGLALDPVIGFNGRYPVLTIFLASVVLVIGTTTIRHFLVDWAMMARTQEAMRKFQKDFAEARKANNTYKMKKLTEAQPRVFELQANLQKDQLKPMAFTMLLVIPLFAWLGTHVTHEVGFELAEAPDTAVAVALTQHGRPVDAFVAGPDTQGTEVMRTSFDVYGFSFAAPGAGAPTGDVVLANSDTGARFFVHASDAVSIPEDARALDLQAGAYTFEMADPGANTTLTLHGDNGYDVTSVLLAFVDGGRVVAAEAVGTDPKQVTLDRAATLYVVVPDLANGDDVDGAALLTVSGAETREVTVGPGNVVRPTHAEQGPPVYPFSAELPWQDPWSLQAFWWILPNWILLYSLFGIPFGQIAQRALKLWEYRHVDIRKEAPA